MGEGNGRSTGMEAEAVKRKQTLILVLCKYLSVNHDSLPKSHIEWPDLKSICLDLAKSSGKENILGASSDDHEEICKWLAYADSFHLDTNSSLSKLKNLNEILVQRSVLTGKGLSPSIADVVVWISLHDVVVNLSPDDRKQFPNLMRWIDFIQNKTDFSPVFEKLNVDKPECGPIIFAGNLLPGQDGVTSIGPYMNRTNDTKKNIEKGAKPSGKDVNAMTGAANMDKESTSQKKENEKKKVKEEKKNGEKESIEKKDTEVDVTALDIRVGVIHKAWKHPSADSLLVEEIDVGEEKVRQVVSGLAKYYTTEKLLNRRVLVVTNVKPGKLRDVMSAGLVLCASNEDHSIVEPLMPPENAKVGECVTFAGHHGKPEEVLNPKKKQFEKISPHLYTDDKGVATYKGVPFMTSAGFCSSFLVNAAIK